MPLEVVEHIVGRTDGVPLYVEELTKMLLASELLRSAQDQYVLTGALSTVIIPESLQDSLMARLDQLGMAKEVAQLGAVLGREFTYEMLQAISAQDDETLQGSLGQLVETELLYQRGRPPRARYIFKHALIQDEAYASLLTSTRQKVHQRIAQVLEERFPDVVETQPELMAHHCTEAGLTELAIGHWQRAGERAMQRSANAEAISHLTQGLTLLHTLSGTPERRQHEISLQISRGVALITTKGFSAPEVRQTYTRALELCNQIGEAPELCSVLAGLWTFYFTHAEYQTAWKLGEQLLRLAQRTSDQASFLPVSS